ncbi:hypothetical protein ABG768_027013 [Culter alburnus]|uniref:Dynein light chain n=1 Tax=Culter alburnus TaxID=194366 RepID=A0AAW2AC20_CULAL
MPKIEIHKSDMSDEMQLEALQVALLAVNMYEKESDIATNIVKEFDRKHGLTWQCIVGSFGFYVRNKSNSYIFFSVGDKNILLFRTG